MIKAVKKEGVDASLELKLKRKHETLIQAEHPDIIPIWIPGVNLGLFNFFSGSFNDNEWEESPIAGKWYSDAAFQLLSVCEGFNLWQDWTFYCNDWREAFKGFKKQTQYFNFVKFTRGYVVWAYHLFLNADPDSQIVPISGRVGGVTRCPDVDGMCRIEKFELEVEFEKNDNFNLYLAFPKDGSYDIICHPYNGSSEVKVARYYKPYVPVAAVKQLEYGTVTNKFGQAALEMVDYPDLNIIEFEAQDIQTTVATKDMGNKLPIMGWWIVPPVRNCPNYEFYYCDYGGEYDILWCFAEINYTVDGVSYKVAYAGEFGGDYMHPPFRKDLVF